eukprot:6173887-Pleurochrysis_carterae.AAC.4
MDLQRFCTARTCSKVLFSKQGLATSLQGKLVATSLQSKGLQGQAKNVNELLLSKRRARF